MDVRLSIASLTLALASFLPLGTNAIALAAPTKVSHKCTCLARETPAARISALKWESRSHRPRPRTALFESENDEDPADSHVDTTSAPAKTEIDNELFGRFLSPRIDDPGLPLTDALFAQVVAPTFQIYWLSLSRAASPSWLRPISSYLGEAPELAPRGSFLAPALIHGAGLAVCWLAGALAARMFERESFTVKGAEDGGRRGGGSLSVIFDTIGRYDAILIGLIKAGAFASGILIVSTQLDLLLEFKGYVQYGESSETDLRLLIASAEVINDIFWEALVIGTWRIIHANFMSSPGNRMRRF